VAAPQGLIAAIDQVIAHFNARKMDLPDGFFDRKAQFTINGAAFETLLGQSPTDPLILMLTRGPAGYRFTAKAVQHAVPDARLTRGDLSADGIAFTLRLSGTVRGTGEVLNVPVTVSLRLNAAGLVDLAEAVMDEPALDTLRQARLRP
jgi:hypothetical protein